MIWRNHYANNSPDGIELSAEHVGFELTNAALPAVPELIRANEVPDREEGEHERRRRRRRKGRKGSER